MLQACQGNVHPENLIGSLWSTVEMSKLPHEVSPGVLHV